LGEFRNLPETRGKQVWEGFPPEERTLKGESPRIRKGEKQIFGGGKQTSKLFGGRLPTKTRVERHNGPREKNGKRYLKIV